MVYDTPVCAGAASHTCDTAALHPRFYGTGYSSSGIAALGQGILVGLFISTTRHHTNQDPPRTRQTCNNSRYFFFWTNFGPDHAMFRRCSMVISRTTVFTIVLIVHYSNKYSVRTTKLFQVLFFFVTNRLALVHSTRKRYKLEGLKVGVPLLYRVPVR